MDSQLEKRVSLTNTLATLFSLATVSFSVVFAWQGLTTLAWISGGWTLTILASIVANRRGYTTLSRVNLLIATEGIGFLVCWLLGQDTRFHQGYFCVIGTPLILFGRHEKVYLWGGVALAVGCYFTLEHLPASMVLREVLSPSVQWVMKIVIDWTVIVVGFLSVFYFYNANERSEARLRETVVHLEKSVKETRDAQAMVVQSSKMAALGEMAGGVAHEINTPLAIIKVLSEQMEEIVSEGSPDPRMLGEMSRDVVSTVNRIARIVQGLKDFCRDGSKDPLRATLLAKCVEDTISLCNDKFVKNGVELKVAPLPAELKVACRSVQISQVLVNLLGNAVDAVKEDPKPWVSLDVAVKSEWVEIAVMDCGRGIPEPVREKLFQPFFTTKEIGKGTGLGLSLSKGLIEGHGGSLFLDTASPNTRFVIRLPNREIVVKPVA